MSCPDWPAVTAWRRGDGAAPRGWSAELAHLAGCATCRRRVAELDPTLLLAAAAAEPVGAPAPDEAQALAATVRALVRASRLAESRRRRRQPLIAAAGVAALLAAGIGLSRWSLPLAPAPAGIAGGAPAAELAAEPLIEEIRPAAARVYQFRSEALPVVLIVDESLDL